MANNGQDNLIPFNQRTEEEQRAIARMGGIASGEARREKATMKQALKLLLNEVESETGKTYNELVALGLVKGAIQGKAENYKTIALMNGELEPEEQVGTPQVNINIVDNSDLEKVLYEDENNENQ